MKNKRFWVSLIAGILAFSLLLGLVASVLPMVHAEQSSDEIKEQIKEMEKENAGIQADIDSLNGQLAELNSQQAANRDSIESIVGQKALIDQQVGLLHAQVLNMNEQIAAYNVLIADKQEEVEEAEARLQELNEKNKERIRAMEEDGSISYWSVLFEANSFSDLLDRLNMVQEIAAADSRRLEELRQAAQEVQDARESLLTERDALKAAKAELNATQEALQLKGVEADELLNELTVKMSELAQQEDAYEDYMQKLEQELEDLELQLGQAQNDLEEALDREYWATYVPPTTKPTYPTGGSNSGAGKVGDAHVDESGITWLTPCDYRKVSSPFGWRIHPVHKDWRHHNGVDFDADCLMKKDGTTDSPIVATRAGVVTVATWSNSAGWYVKIDHLDGYASVYMHMCTRPDVKVGEYVTAGQYLGCIGTTGTSTGDHLHFGITKYDEKTNSWDYVDPMKYVG